MLLIFLLLAESDLPLSTVVLILVIPAKGCYLMGSLLCTILLLIIVGLCVADFKAITVV